MSLADIRIVIVFFLIVGFVALFSAVFGMRGTYFILGISAIANALFGIFSLIANGKL
jgi:peptidoglycan biosynthesis protein MviN/MurJ (putative lipid II flippase)